MFFILEYGYADRVDICGSTFCDFCIRVIPFPQMRPEVCCNHECFVALNECTGSAMQ